MVTKKNNLNEIRLYTQNTLIKKRKKINENILTDSLLCWVEFYNTITKECWKVLRWKIWPNDNFKKDFFIMPSLSG